MPTVVYSARSLEHLEHAFRYLRDKHPDAAADAVTAICSAVDNLAAHPLVGRRIEVYAGADNVLDADYEESYGIPQIGRFVYAGIKLHLP